MERDAPRAQGRVERDQGAMQPPALGAAMRPAPGRRVVQHVDGEEGAVLHGMERGVVGEAEILAEPEQGRAEHEVHMGAFSGVWMLQPP
jgi:hypothetical protein